MLGLNRKLDDETERNHIKMIWDECLPREFTSFTLQKENFIQLSGLTVTYQKALELVKNFLDLSENHLALLKQSLEKYLDEIRYVYSTYFPKIYNRTNKLGIKNKTVLEFTYTIWLNKKHDKKKQQHDEKTESPNIGKNAFPFEKQQEIHEFEQQPIVADDILGKYEITRTVLSKPKPITTKQILDEKARKS